MDSEIKLNNYLPQNIEVNTDISPPTITWLPPNTNIRVDHYDVICSTFTTNNSHLQMTKVGNLSPNISMAEINGLLSVTMYNCCVIAHVPLKGIPLQIHTTSTACVSLNTTRGIVDSLDGNSCINPLSIIGLGCAFSIVSLLCVGCLFITIYYKYQNTKRLRR